MGKSMNKSELLTLSLEDKIKRSKELILEWYLQFNGKVYISFSGGKDSTVLLHLTRSLNLCKDTPGVFCDTGLEYPEIRTFVKKQENIIWIKPKMTFRDVLKKYGWPIIGKEQSRYLYDVMTSSSMKLRQIRLEGRNGSKSAGFLAYKWRPLLSADFKISNKCCEVMKKRPMQLFEKETERRPMIGVMAQESRLRYEQFLKGNCNAFSEKHPKSRPIMFWTEQDVLQYIRCNKLDIASVYGRIVEEDGILKTTGVKRTGCMFCMYGVHMEEHPNRFEQMKETHPSQYRYIMDELGGRHILDEYLSCNAGGQCSFLK